MAQDRQGEPTDGECQTGGEATVARPPDSGLEERVVGRRRGAGQKSLSAPTTKRQRGQSIRPIHKNLTSVSPRRNLEILDGDRAVLESWSRSRTHATRLVQRSRIVLQRAAGASRQEVADAVGVAVGTVRLWEQRYARYGLDGLRREAPGRGRKAPMAAVVAAAVVAANRLGVRAAARALGVSASTLSRWRNRLAVS